MNSWRKFVVITIAALACCSYVFGHDGGYRNAAKHYERAFERYVALSSDDRSLLLNFDIASTPPTQEIRDAMRRAQPILNDFHRASLQPYSDFHLDYNQGFNLVIPHVVHMRNIVRLAKADVQLRLADGDSAGAADRLAAMGRNLQHYNDDRLLISSLVNSAVYALVDDTIQHGLDAAAFDPAEALKILQPLEQLNATGDPFGYRDSIATEQDWIVMAMTDAFENDRMSETLDLIWVPDDDHADPTRDAWNALKQDEFELHVAAYDQFMDGVVEVFAMDDPDLAAEKMTEFSDAFVDSEYNLFATVIISYNHILRSKHHSERLLQDRISDLRDLVEGEVDAHAIANAAVWYLRGITLLSDLDEDATKLLREDHLWDTPLPDELVQMLRDTAQPIIHEFRMGSEIRRCDFSIARSLEYPLIPRYTPGMRDAFHLLHADAIRLMHADELEDAAERLAICYRMIGHLGRDAQLISGLVSHTAFEHTHLLVEATIEAEQFTTQQIRTVGAAFDRIGRADPFGYAAAVRMTRQDIGKTAENLARRIDADPKERRYQILQQIITHGTPDQLLTLLALHDAYLRHREQELFEAGHLPAELKTTVVEHDALMDVVSIDDLSTLRNEAQLAIASMVNTPPSDADAHMFDGLTTFTDINARMQQARAVLRIGAAMFHLTTAASDTEESDPS